LVAHKTAALAVLVGLVVAALVVAHHLRGRVEQEHQDKEIMAVLVLAHLITPVAAEVAHLLQEQVAQVLQAVMVAQVQIGNLLALTMLAVVAQGLTSIVAPQVAVVTAVAVMVQLVAVLELLGQLILVAVAVLGVTVLMEALVALVL
jgi:hypothetical protein